VRPRRLITFEDSTTQPQFFFILITKRAPDWWESARFQAVCVAWSGFRQDSLSRPAHQRVTHTDGADKSNHLTKVIIMKIPVKTFLLILGSLIFGYIGFYMPVTRIQYQVNVDKSQLDASTHILAGEGLTNFSDKKGTGAIPCQYPRWEFAPSFFEIGFQVWQFTGEVLSIGAIFFAFIYLIQRAVRHKMQHRKFFIMVALLLGGPVAILLIFRSPSIPPMCNPASLYKIVAFAPYWPTVFILVIGILLGIWGYFSFNDSKLKEVETRALD
jgi:quinol-cytochrome oxidoreductase complex cytochrome b subunit